MVVLYTIRNYFIDLIMLKLTSMTRSGFVLYNYIPFQLINSPSRSPPSTLTASCDAVQAAGGESSSGGAKDAAEKNPDDEDANDSDDVPEDG
jgi:hypothetical protein